jgi:uncharacterized protein VirK/YbjX
MAKSTSLTVKNTLQLQGRLPALRLFFHDRLKRGTLAAWKQLVSEDLPPGFDDNARIRIGRKVFRPYLRRHLRIPDKINVLSAHYRALGARMPAAAAALSAGRTFPLAVLTGKGGAAYRVLLRQETTKEGEVSFLLMEGDAEDADRALATLRGLIGADGDGRTVFWIGGMQGAKPPMGRDDIVRATRELNGLRPKHAVLQAACAFSRWMRLDGLIAPGRTDHISMRGWRRWSRKRKITAEYDEFWAEFSSSRQEDGDYCLPVTLPVRSEEDVKSKKRKEWRLRHERLQGIAAEAQAALEALVAG